MPVPGPCLSPATFPPEVLRPAPPGARARGATHTTGRLRPSPGHCRGKMSSSFTTAQRNAALDALTGSYAGALLRVYSGAVPANAEAALGGATLLAELTLGSPAFGAASGGALTANPITREDSTVAAGTASFFRLVDSGGSTVLSQGDVGLAGSGAALIVPTTSVVLGQPFEVSALTVTSPASV